jgi:hypothetical protein
VRVEQAFNLGQELWRIPTIVIGKGKDFSCGCFQTQVAGFREPRCGSQVNNRKLTSEWPENFL